MNEASSTSRGNRLLSSFLIALGFASLAAFGIRTIAHGGFWGHLAAGRWIIHNGIMREEVFSFTRLGARVVDAPWLYDVLLFGMFKVGGPVLVIMTHVLAVVAGFLFLLPVARRYAGPVSLGAGVLLGAWVLAPLFTVNPAILCLPFPALFIWLLTRETKPGWLWGLLLPAQVFWTNLHVSFFLGPLIAALFAIERAYAAASNPTTRARAAQGLVLTLALAAVTLVNPYGLALHQLALSSLLDPSLLVAQEYVSPLIGQFGRSLARHALTLAFFVGAAGLITERQRLPLALTTLAVVAAFLTVRSLIFSDYFALLAFPFICLSLRATAAYVLESLEFLKAHTAACRAGVQALLLVFNLATLAVVVGNRYFVSVGSLSGFGMGIAEDVFPAAAARVLAPAYFPDRAINLAMDGGFLAWEYPWRPICVDERGGVYGRELYDDLTRYLLNDAKAAERIEGQWAPGAVVLNCVWPGAGSAVRALVAGGRWRMEYFDGTTAVLLPADKPHPRLSGNAALRDAGLREIEAERRRYSAALGQLSAPPTPARLVGAGNIYMAMNRYPEARAVYELLVRGVPGMGSAWLNLGICLYQMNEVEPAIGCLQNATRLLPQNAMAWLWLGEALQKAGNSRAAESAFARGRELNPSQAATFLNKGVVPPPTVEVQ